MLAEQQAATSVQARVHAEIEAAEAERRASAALGAAAEAERRAKTALGAAAQWEARALEAKARLREDDNQRTEDCLATSSREIAACPTPPDATMSDLLVLTRAAAEVRTRVLA